ncbi:MAG: protein-L-isoaspartate O-methyltransferase [Hyphomicrobium sp.]
MVDAATQRLNMVESQVLTSDVTDRRILRAMRELPRELYVPAPMAALAYMDEPVPLTPPGPGRRWLLAPRLQAKLLQLASIDEGDCVLDVGCASGYSSAVLAGMAKTVVALESDVRLAEQARTNLAVRGLDNVEVVVGELTSGWATKAPFDAIIIEGAVPLVPEMLFDQLKDGGCLVAIVCQDGLGKATIWRRLGRSVDSWTAFDATTPALPGFERAAVFVL